MFEGFDGWLRIKDDFLEPKAYSVSELSAHCNFILEREFSDIYVEGEVASFKINQGKWVFFDLKDETSSISCFLPLPALGVAISDGMRIKIRATPKLTRLGKFSLTVQGILPLGEGNIKKSFELLKQKLAKEGLFDPARKRPLPSAPVKIGVISSTASAGYRDFLKILDNRWGGIKISTINTQVQGLIAIKQIVQALETFNQQGEVEVIAILRGGGSADDLAIFNDESLVRAVAKSRIPVLAGIGHEIDESLVDLVADVRASTPSNAAEILVPDRHAILKQTSFAVARTKRQLDHQISELEDSLHQTKNTLHSQIQQKITALIQRIQDLQKIIQSYNPEAALKRGYALIREMHGAETTFSPGDQLSLITHKQTLTAEIKDAQKRQ